MLSKACLEVDIVAYGGSDPHSAVLEHQYIHFHKMKPWPAIPHMPKILQPLMLLFKPVFQFLVLLWFLCVKIPVPDVFIVQIQLLSSLDLKKTPQLLELVEGCRGAHEFSSRKGCPKMDELSFEESRI
ncbi:UDP-glycosyltransferase TURAN isoform X2 [Daucus carota subsp. sativus]|uniref:UDP-glycosyltransferase TURAN isoform X2 n=1 Tax=Daucus carota subsp. sativus TaxID=79200 RepID=UPI003082C654